MAIKGTRLKYTDSCPKPMLLVGNKPILEILLERCIASGFHKFFSVNYLKDQIIDYFGDGSRWGVSIKYLVEEKPWYCWFFKAASNSLQIHS